MQDINSLMRVHVNVSLNWVTFALDNGLACVPWETINWTSGDLLSLNKIFGETLIEMLKKGYAKITDMYVQIASHVLYMYINESWLPNLLWLSLAFYNIFQ